ncbi:Rossman fold protein, TIGR00730 family [candidate division TM6 bacterium RIFCSPHIGHO2_12_FULL_36_22]|nr:MAG: Rossman fold protein, TIGR00730 family [candidate division TM6 bacterium RIFCSPHIGHO2_12_FULL_36_22]
MFTRCLECIKNYSKFFVHWIRVTWQMAWGISKLTQAKPPRITFFGGVQLKRDDKHAKAAYKLAAKLASANIAVITGGGLGLMEAANCGARSAKSSAANIGITVRGLDRENLENTCSRDLIVMEFFCARKWLLINYSTAFVVFPGGFGTMDEFSQVITLIQTKKIKQVPVILFGVDYWRYIMLWLKESALPNNLITQKDLDLIIVSDDIEKVFTVLNEECRGTCLLNI